MFVWTDELEKQRVESVPCQFEETFFSLPTMLKQERTQPKRNEPKSAPAGEVTFSCWLQATIRIKMVISNCHKIHTVRIITSGTVTNT
jgi:hypothetical protein